MTRVSDNLNRIDYSGKTWLLTSPCPSLLQVKSSRKSPGQAEKCCQELPSLLQLSEALQQHQEGLEGAG